MQTPSDDAPPLQEMAIRALKRHGTMLRLRDIQHKQADKIHEKTVQATLKGVFALVAAVASVAFLALPEAALAAPTFTYIASALTAASAAMFGYEAARDISARGRLQTALGETRDLTTHLATRALEDKIAVEAAYETPRRGDNRSWGEFVRDKPQEPRGQSRMFT